MEVRYLAVYRFLGVNELPGNADTQSFLSLPQLRAATTLTVNPEPFCFHLDQATALAAQLLKGFFGQDKQGTPEERLAAEVEEVRTDRQKRHKSGVFLVFEGTDDIASPDFKIRRDTNDFAVCFDAFPKGEVREKFRPVLYGVLTAISVALPAKADSRIAKVGEISYLVEPEGGKPIYSFTAEAGSVTVSVSTPLTEAAIEHARKQAQAFPVNDKLAKVANLFIESKHEATDDLRAFIGAWSALEIFVNAMFKAVYQDLWFQIMSLNAPTSSRKYFDRLRGVMNDKHRLADKFLIIASILDPAAAEEDAAVFNRLKSARDGLFHASEGAMSRYPVEDTQHLLRKYVDLHLAQHGRPAPERDQT